MFHADSCGWLRPPQEKLEMAIAQAMLPEFDHEMANTRRMLERAPEDQFGWRPHEKSPTLGWLLSHLVELPGWLQVALTTDEFDVAPPGEPPHRTTEQVSVAAALTAFDANVAAARSTLAAGEDSALLSPWSLKHAGQVILTLPKVGVVRGFVLNHSIHHRAQLGLYLRLLDVPVPAIYGPSADEGGM